MGNSIEGLVGDSGDLANRAAYICRLLGPVWLRGPFHHSEEKGEEHGIWNHLFISCVILGMFLSLPEPYCHHL